MRRGAHPLDERTRGGKVRSASMRKLAGDGKSWTPTEERKRNQLMRQFMKHDVPLANSSEYQVGYDAIDWGRNDPKCFCGHYHRSHPGGRCIYGCEPEGCE